MADVDSLGVLVDLIPLKDIIVNAVGGFLGGLALLWLALGWDGIRTLKSRLQRPTIRIERSRTPANIFTGLELSAPSRWVEKQLGPPTSIGDGWWGYRFLDSLVLLRFGRDDSLNSIAVGLVDTTATFEFPAWHFECPPLGKITIEDLLKADHLDLKFQESLRHTELVVTGREGPTGAWHHIAFGALSPNAGVLRPADFAWDREKGELITRPQDVKVNWAAVSRTSDIEAFPWDFGLTI